MSRLVRFESLWDMLNRIEAGRLIASHAHLKAFLHKIHRVIDDGKASRNPTWVCRLPKEDIEYGVLALRTVGIEAARLKFQGIPAACIAIGEELIDCEGLFNINTLQNFHSGLTNIVTQLPNVLDESAIFILSNDSVNLLEAEDPFGQVVSGAFPSAVYDIQEAAKCRAYERWTASVLHLMRALETPILALQAEVNVNVPKDQWEQMVVQIESKIKQMALGSHDKVELAWFSEAAAHFRIIKNAWRNFAMHGKDSYDEARAVNIYESVRAFTQHLATRLKE